MSKQSYETLPYYLMPIMCLCRCFNVAKNRFEDEFDNFTVHFSSV